MQVEVCVQDAVAEELAEKDSGLSNAVSCPVSEEIWERWFQAWLEVLQPNLSPIGAYELSLRLTGDREIQALNYQYRQQDKPTDVLAFASLETASPLTEELNTLPLYLGDIVISLATAQRQADSQPHPLATELAWLAAHGLLHLLGWDHPNEESLVRMLNQQQALLEVVGVPIQTS